MCLKSAFWWPELAEKGNAVRKISCNVFHMRKSQWLFFGCFYFHSRKRSNHYKVSSVGLWSRRFFVFGHVRVSLIYPLGICILLESLVFSKLITNCQFALTLFICKDILLFFIYISILYFFI